MNGTHPHSIDDAVALHRSGRLDEADAIYQAILQQQPDHADALHLSGQLEIQRGNHAAAFGLIRRATELQPDNPVFYSSLGAALKGLGHFDAAVASYDMALAIQADYAEAHYNRGNALVELRQHAQAVASYDEAIRLQPDHAEAHYNRGNALRALRDIPAAIASYDRAIEINSQHTDARLSLGNALHDSGHIDAAKASFAAVITQDAGCAQALWGKSLSLLLSGEFEAGWQLYESRWDQPFGQSQRRDFAQPLWLGREPLAGRTVLLHSEQGLGDTIQFCRYARLVAERGARVVLEVPPALVGLMSTLAGVDQIVAQGQALPAFDLHCPLMSLPLALGTRVDTIPASAAYLHSEPQRLAHWRERLGPRRQPLRVGLVWSGSTGNVNDANRSLSLAALLAQLPDAFEYVSLQKELRPADAATLEASGMRHFGHELRDFSDTAALCDLMDLVISVDTSVAHLSGALGKTTWVLVQYVPDFRWLLGRSDSPWYPSVTLIRQQVDGTWASVLERLQTELLRLIPPPLHEARADDALFTQALELHSRDELAAAQALYQRVLAEQPRHFGALHMLGAIEIRQGRPAIAVEWLCKALEVNLQSAEAFYDLGCAVCLLKQYDAGVQCFDKALALRPGFAAAHCDRGNALLDLGRAQEALASQDQALAIEPELALAHVYRGNALQALARSSEAVAAYDRALALDATLAEAHLNRGNALQALGDFAAAVASYDHAIACRPDDTVAWVNRCSALKREHRLDAAVASCERAIAIDPECVSAHWNKSLALLLAGELRSGFAPYEWRWKTEAFAPIVRHFDQPLWLGHEPIASKTLLIHTEQGLGDTVQFARYVKPLAAAGARVVLEVVPALFDLMQSLGGVARLVRRGDVLPAFDFHCPTLSLPLACGTELHSVPADVPYLRADAARVAGWSRRLGARTRPRIGLVWSGSPSHRDDHHRSIALGTLLAGLPAGFDYVSLQKNVRESDLAALQSASGIAHFGDELHDLADTAALCSLMDVVISVDTSVAHVAGALGMPTWVLLPHTPDWRWLLDRDDSPWYPSARLYRQDARRQWAPVLQRVAADLCSLQSAAGADDACVALHQQGCTLCMAGRYEEGLACFDRAVQLQPRFAQAHCDRGTALMDLRRPAQALLSYEQAIALDPAHAMARNYLGNALMTLNRPAEAVASYDAALAIAGDLPDVQVNKALALLLAGRLREGFGVYEWRWKTALYAPFHRGFAQPLWLGDTPLAGKTLLIHSEQGHGDTIQFARYAQQAAAAGAQVVLEVKAPLVALMRDLPGVTCVVRHGDALPAFDVHCPTMSLPLAFRTELSSVPAPVHYLQADAAKVAAWSARLGPRTRTRVGLVWSGSATHDNDANRSIALTTLLAQLPDGVDFVSLQKDVRERDRAALQSASHIACFADELHDFSDTAALCSLMDVVVTVDTSVAHLAGALGVPTWVLLPHHPDWRWLLDRTDSPWYPSMRLYRQDASGSWDAVLQRVAADLRPSHFEQGLRFQQQGALEQAKASYLQVLAAQPAHFDALHMLGVVEVNLGRAEVGVDWLCKALEVEANSAAAFSSLGHAMCVLKQYEAGIECYDKALALQPQSTQTLGDRGSALLELGRPLEALASYDQVIAIQPDDALAHCNRGTALLSLGRAREAIASHDRALSLHSDLPEAWLNRGNACQALDDHEAAVASYDRAIACRPNYPMAFANRCSALQELHRLDEAIASCDQAIALDAGFTEAWWNKALALLLQGELREGFALYQRRWQMHPFTTIARHFKQPLWLGDVPLAGKTLLIHSEQGLGDTIQFARFAQQVSVAGARVVFEVEKPLFDLFRSLPGVDVLVRQGDALPDFDLHCPTMSLPIGCRTDLSTLSTTTPYLRADAAKVAAWSARLGAATRPRVGLVCSGSTTHKNDHHRSIALAGLLAALPEGIECFSLQKEMRESDRLAAKAGQGIAFFGDELRDFADTAALCSLMDVVITVDTSVAHLAGALGVPTWVLLPHTPDWRWLLDRDDSPWYPSARLYRQDARGQWAPVLQRVAADLRRL
jgi:tetratricopeptide (TPR) repeat protein